MRYVISILIAVTIIGGTYFNEFVLKTLDVAPLGNTMDYQPYTDTFQLYRDVTIAESSVTLSNVDEFWRSSLRNLMTKYISSNGAEVSMIGGVPITQSHDPQKGWGASASDYSISFQGYNPENPDTFQNYLAFTLADASLGYLSPGSLTFVKEYDDFLVVKMHFKGLTDSEDDFTLSADNYRARAEIIESFSTQLEALQSKGKGSITKDTLTNFETMLKDSSVAQMLQLSMLHYYSVRFDSTFKDFLKAKSSSYRVSKNGASYVTAVAELQYIYDKLQKAPYYYNKRSAAELTFMIEQIYLANYQAIKLSDNLVVETAWTKFEKAPFKLSIKGVFTAAGDFLTSMGDAVVEFFTGKKQIDDATAEKLFYRWVANLSRNYTSPVLLFCDLNMNANDSSGKEVLEALALYYQAAQSNPNVNGSSIYLEWTEPRMDLILDAYFYIMGNDGSLGRTNGLSTVTKSNYITEYKSGWWSHLVDSVVEFGANYGIRTYACMKDSGFRNDIKSILSTKATSDPTQIVLRNAFDIFVDVCYTNNEPSSLSRWRKTINNEEQLNYNYNLSVGKGFYAFVTSIASNDLQFAKLKHVNIHGSQYKSVYLYPYMAMGDSLAVTVSDMLNYIQEETGGLVDFTKYMYLAITGYDKEKYKLAYPGNNMGVNQTSLETDDPFLFPAVVNGEVQPIKLYAYWEVDNSTHADSFNETKAKWGNPSWYTDERYVNIWKGFYGEQTLAELEAFSGKITNDRAAYLDMFSSMSSSKKTIQTTYGADYEKIMNSGGDSNE